MGHLNHNRKERGSGLQTLIKGTIRFKDYLDMSKTKSQELQLFLYIHVQICAAASMTKNLLGEAIQHSSANLLLVSSVKALLLMYMLKITCFSLCVKQSSLIFPCGTQQSQKGIVPGCCSDCLEVDIETGSITATDPSQRPQRHNHMNQMTPKEITMPIADATAIKLIFLWFILRPPFLVPTPWVVPLLVCGLLA